MGAELGGLHKDHRPGCLPRELARPRSCRSLTTITESASGLISAHANERVNDRTLTTRSHTTMRGRSCATEYRLLR